MKFLIGTTCCIWAAVLMGRDSIVAVIGHAQEAEYALDMIVYGGPFCVFVLVLLYFVRRCPECGRFGSLEATGKFRDGTLTTGHYEVKCKNCGETSWKQAGGGHTG